MKPCLYTRADLALDLRALHGMAINDERSLRTWYGEARRVQDLLRDNEATEKLASDEFHFLMHYLIDADLRFKDPEYARMQNDRLLELLATLES